MTGKKILVTDDERGILELIRKYFLNTEYRIDTTEDAAAAIKMISTGRYPVVVTDLCFPGKLSGLDVLKAARRHSEKTEVIIMSAYGSVQSAVDAMKQGAYDYLTKPFDFFELKTLLDRVFEMKDVGRRLEDNHEAMNALEVSAGKKIRKAEALLRRKEAALRRVGAYAQALLKNTPEKHKNRALIRKILAEAGDTEKGQ